MNVSMQDGFNLRWKLGAVVTGLADAAHQERATGFPIGKRFKSAPVTRAADGNVVHLGHHAKADGRWRIYAFADADGTALADSAGWLADAPDSPIVRHTPAGADIDAVFDAKVIYPGGYDEIDVTRVPAIFRPRTGPLHLTDWEKVFAAAPNRWNATDIYAERGISRDGAVVVVRPDQYVAGVFPLDGVDGVQELAVFFDAWLL